MADWNIILSYWWIPAIIVGVIIFAFVLKKFVKGNKKKEKYHKHKWRTIGHANLKDNKGKEKLRLVLFCEECLECIHTPIHTLKQLAEIEQNENN